MKGVNQVPDFLEEIGEILEYESDFTDRDPVYLIDPTASEFGIEMVGTIAPVPTLSTELALERPPLKQPLVFMRHLVRRSVVLRINSLIEQINESVGLRFGALTESVRRLARSHRHLEQRVAALSRERRSPKGPTADRIIALEQKVRLLELSVAALEDAIDKLEAEHGGASAPKLDLN